MTFICKAKLFCHLFECKYFGLEPEFNQMGFILIDVFTVGYAKSPFKIFTEVFWGDIKVQGYIRNL